MLVHDSIVSTEAEVFSLKAVVNLCTVLEIKKKKEKRKISHKDCASSEILFVFWIFS